MVRISAQVILPPLALYNADRMMITTNRNKQLIALIVLFSIFLNGGFQFVGELPQTHISNTQQDPDLKLYKKNLNDFTLKSGEEFKLINSAIKQDYEIFFSGEIVDFDTLIIGKGFERYLSSYITIDRDSVIFSRITRGKTTKSYKHNLRLINNLTISIDKKLDSTVVTIINEKDTLQITSDFIGMNNPFIRSLGSVLYVNEFKFICNDYYSDIYVFGDSYVNCASPQRWPYYLYPDFKFFCDALPGGRSVDSYDFLNSALSVHKPKFVIWCLGMNDGSDKSDISPSWKHYVNKVMDLCAQNSVTLILSTVPSVPKIDHTGKNKFVRESGYRYIDFDEAVSDGIGNWKSGMLSNDGVHPSEVGAKSMADRLLIDFPEIKKYTK